jgi:hypothetical protein
LSSILKALKKLEKDTPRYGDSQPYPVDVRKTVEKGVKEKQNSYKIFFMLFAAIILVFGGWLLLSRKPFLEEKSSSTKISSARKPVAQKKKKEEVKLASIPDLKPRKKRAKPFDRIKKNENLPSSRQVKIPASRKVMKKKFYGDNRTKPKSARSAISFKSSGGTGLKLQAIAWSRDSKESIAVVNGRILREGSSIEGSLIIKIDKNDVSFQKGGEQWKQKFGPL